MAVGKDEAHRVGADPFPVVDFYAGILRPGISPVNVPEEIGFAFVFGARGGRTERIHGVDVFALVGPNDGDEVTDESNLSGSRNHCRSVYRGRLEGKQFDPFDAGYNSPDQKYRADDNEEEEHGLAPAPAT